MEGNKSVYDLAYGFINKYYVNEPPNTEKIKIINDFINVLNLGWTEEKITLELFKHSKNGQVPNLRRIFNRYTGRDRNILKSGHDVFYYHNFLRVTAPPPMKQWDLNSGTIQTLSQDYFLEMRSSLTISDLADYFIDRMGLDRKYVNDRKIYGATEWLLEKHDVDLILFMIDTASDIIKSNDLAKLQSPVMVVEYLDKSQDKLNKKMSENKASGDDMIVFKKRVLSNRGRSQESQLLHTQHHNYA